MDYIIDAKNQRLGRLATHVASMLQGKHKASYEPRLSGSGRVIVKNAAKVTVSGRKETQKIYYHHTGYVGHLKKEVYKDAFKKSPDKVIRHAVYNMLPKNRLRQKRMNRLRIEE